MRVLIASDRRERSNLALRLLRRPLRDLLAMTGGAGLAITVSLSPALGEEIASIDALGFSRGELLVRRHQYEPALREFGHLSKTIHEDPLFQKRVEQALAALYRPTKIPLASSLAGNPRFQNRIRVTRRKQDSTRNADQSGDSRGWQINESFSGVKENPDGVSTRFAIDLDGFRNGHNDLRYRTLLADFFQGASHLGLGDSASFTSPYFLRGSRLRGLNLIMTGDTHEFQAVAGAYPFWLEERDAYIYPRTVWGLRDQVRLFADRLRFGGGIIQTRDSEKIRTIDVANRPRDNIVFSFDQEVKVIPEVWFLKAAESLSTTDDGLIEDRFGHTEKLKDTSFLVESLFIQPSFRWKSCFERTGPDFRFLTDVPSGSVVNSKGFTSDRQFVQHELDLNPMGPFDLDLEASWMRNNLDDDSAIEQTRQSWYAVDLGIEVPPLWPHPRLRGTLSDAVSVPGSTTRPTQVRTMDVIGDLSKNFGTTSATVFASYDTEHPLDDKKLFSDESRWAVGTRMSRPLGEKLLLSGRYRYQAFDELFDEVRDRGIRHETSAGGSLRLWSSASLSLYHNFYHGESVNPEGTRLTKSEGQGVTANFTWPYTRRRWDKRRKFSFFPGVTAHVTDLDRDLQERPFIASRLGVAYEAYPDWKLELLGEFRWEDDDETDQVRTEGSRMWLLWTSRFE